MSIILLRFTHIRTRKMNGKEAYLKIKRLPPDIKTHFVSGYSADIIHRKGILETGQILW